MKLFSSPSPMWSRFFILSFSSLFPFFLFAQDLKGLEASRQIPGSKRIFYRKGASQPAYVEFIPGSGPSSVSFEAWFRTQFELPSEIGFRQRAYEKDELGMEHLRLTITWKQFPVRGSELILHLRSGTVESFSADFSGKPQGQTSARISEEAALQKALQHISASVYKWQVPAEEEFIKYQTGSATATYFPTAEKYWIRVGNSLRLAYRFDVYAHLPLSRSWIFIDAENGSILETEERIHEADQSALAVTGHSGIQIVTTFFDGQTYKTKETGRGNGIETYRLNGGFSYPNSSLFSDPDNFWDLSVYDAQKGKYWMDAHFGAEKTYDFYLNKFGRNSIDNQGFKLLSYVNADLTFIGYQNENNAFWDGSRMTYGDGEVGRLPFTTLDICGHEITHGLTEKTAQLVYQGESGALNEAYSDIFGTCIEFYGNVSNTANWLIGEQTNKALRSMANPEQFNQPDTYLGRKWYSGSLDNGGVHVNSGVMNHWFYLTSVGGEGFNDNFLRYKVQGIGMDKASRIAYRTLVFYLLSTADYSYAALSTELAAKDLYGECSQEWISTKQALAAIGLGNMPFPGPEFSVGPLVELCPGTQAQLKVPDFASTYQWYLNGASISAANGSAYQTGIPGFYQVETSWCGVTKRSDSVEVRVLNESALISQTNTANPCQGSASLTADVSDRYSVQWLRNGQEIPGANASTFTALESGQYQARANRKPNPVFSADSAPRLIPRFSCDGLRHKIHVEGMPSPLDPTRLAVHVKAQIQYVKRLALMLVSPDKADSLILHYRVNAQGDNLDAVFSAKGTKMQNAPYTGEYLPLDSLISFCGGEFKNNRLRFEELGNGSVQVNGDWELVVLDALQAPDSPQGILDSWAIEILPESGLNPDCGPLFSNVLSVDLSGPAPPQVTASGPLRFCQGGQVVLTTNASGNHRWNTGSTSSQISVSQPGIYVDTLLIGTCKVVSNALLVEVGSLPLVNAGPDQIFVQGSGTTTLTAPVSGGQWSGPGVSAAGVFSLNQTPGNYPLTYCKTAGLCTACDTLVVQLLGSGSVATPQILPGGGTFDGPTSITLSCSTPGASILYTTSGNVPVAGTSFTKIYSGPFVLNGSGTVRAVAVLTGMNNSNVAVANFSILNPGFVSAPVINLPTGSYSGPVSVEINSSTVGAQVYYTLNGNSPRIDVPNGFTKLYTGPIMLNTSVAIRAIAVKTGLLNSPISRADLTISPGGQTANPLISPSGGATTGPVLVSITCASPGASLFYTVNGNLPNLDVPNFFTRTYTGPFTVAAGTTVRAIASAPGLSRSSIVTAVFTAAGARMDVNEDDLVRLDVHPNPASSQITVSLADQPFDALLFNSLGQVVRNESASGPIEISLHGLPSGMYLLRVSSGPGRWERKVLKQ